MNAVIEMDMTDIDATEEEAEEALIAAFGEEVTDLIDECEYIPELGRTVFFDDNGRVIFEVDLYTNEVRVLGPAEE